MSLLSIAGAISGAGQAINQGLHNVQQGLLSSYLQKEREAMELRRQEINHQFLREQSQASFAHADALEGRREAFARGTAEEAFGRDIVKSNLAHGQAVEDRAAERAYQSGRDQEGFGRDVLKENLRHEQQVGDRKDERTYREELDDRNYEKGRGRKDQEADDDLSREERMLGRKTALGKKEAAAQAEIEVDKTNLLASDPTYLKNKRTLADNAESSSVRAAAAQTNFKLERDTRIARLQDQYLDAIASGDRARIEQTKAQYRAVSEKVGEADKLDMVNAAAMARETGVEITRLTTALKDMIPGSPEARATERRLRTAEDQHTAFTERVRELSGTKLPEPAAPIQIKDRYKTTPGEKATPAEGETGEKKETPAGPSVMERAGSLLEGAKTAVTDFASNLMRPYNPNKGGINAEEDAALTRQTLAGEEGTEVPAPAPPPAASKKGLIDAARETAGQVVEGAGQVAESAKRKAGEVVETVGGAVDRATDAVTGAVRGLVDRYKPTVNAAEDAALTQDTLMREDAARHTQDALEQEQAPAVAATGLLSRGPLPTPPAQPAPTDWPRQLTKVLQRDDKLALADSLDIYKKGKMTLGELRNEARDIFKRYFRPEQTDAVLEEFMVVAAQSKKRPGGR